MENVSLITRVVQSLDDSLRRKPWKGNPNLLAGHCYVASEALYYLLGGKSSGLTPQVIRHEDSPHWFLKSDNGMVYDPTAGQFKTPVPYEQGRGCGFLTNKPSKRAQILIDRVMQHGS